MALDTAQLQLIEQRLANDGPNPVAAYLLCVWGGVFGAHRFYLNRSGSGVAMLLISLTFIGLFVTFIWALVDLLFLLGGMIRERQAEIRNDLTMHMMATPTASSAAPAPAA
ncbi:MAG: TM2 domain-containing protein [Caulobacterales bacterium]